MMAGLVSTIIPVYNRARLMSEAVESVLAQDYRPIEVIIVDDGSTDETREVGDALAAAHPQTIRILHVRNGGPGLAREAGRQAAKGEFVQYLDSDDVLLPGKFTAQVAGLRAEPDSGVSYGITLYRNPNGAEDESLRKGDRVARATMFPEMLLQRWWETANPLYRADLCERAGPWTDLRLEEDWEYDCRVASLQPKLHYVRSFVCEHRDHGGARLSRGLALDPSRLEQRARAHELVCGHARRAGIAPGSPAMAVFARSLFLLARQCGAAGLGGDSRRLFFLAREAAGARSGDLEFQVYAAFASVAGWGTAGKLSCWIDRMRRA